MKYCTRCKDYRPAEHFPPAHPDFPTRDGRNYTCGNGEGWHLVRLADGRVAIELLTAVSVAVE